MPYRRLPNTDKSRIRAMENAIRKSISVGPSNCAFPELVFTSLETALPNFQHALINLEASRKNQISKNKEYTEYFKKAKIYISHFIHVLNFSITRGELKNETRDFYGLSSYSHNLPPLNNDKNLIEWGKKLIDGEQKRIQKGGNPIYNPSIALVKVNYEKFAEAYFYQKNLIATSKRASKLVKEIRPEVDRIILQIWNEVENTFSSFDELKKRENSMEYGVSYVFRKHEKIKEIKTVKLQIVKEVKKHIIEQSSPISTEKTNSVPVQSIINF